jgi:hypothetical protein
MLFCVPYQPRLAYPSLLPHRRRRRLAGICARAASGYHLAGHGGMGVLRAVQKGPRAENSTIGHPIALYQAAIQQRQSGRGGVRARAAGCRLQPPP